MKHRSRGRPYQDRLPATGHRLSGRGEGEIYCQQKLIQYHLAVLIICSPSNKLEDLRPHLPQLLEQLNTLQPGQAKYILD